MLSSDSATSQSAPGPTDGVPTFAPASSVGAANSKVKKPLTLFHLKVKGKLSTSSLSILPKAVDHPSSTKYFSRKKNQGNDFLNRKALPKTMVMEKKTRC